MLHRIWLSFIFCAFIACVWQFLFEDKSDSFQLVMNSITTMAKVSVDIALGLIGVLAFWMGIFQVAEKSGLVEKLARLLSPLLCRLMPEIPPNHNAIGSITMNMSANILGLDNAATPFGIKAMQDMQSLNPKSDTISNAQILFLVLNTSSLTLFPIAVFLYRGEQGAALATDVFIPILLATSASSFAGLLVTSWVQKISLCNRVVLLYGAGFIALLSAIIIYFAQLAAREMASQSAIVANSLLLGFIVLVLFHGWRKQLNTYDLFIQGARKGFELAISLIPYMLAMLFAIGMLRASGLLDMIVEGIRTLVVMAGADSRFVDGLPTALMKPLSGSGSRAIMIETMQHHGADSFAGRLASVLQGSTETTFYVLAVYLGAVGIKYTRHAVACCLAADAAGILAAIGVTYWFFG